MGHEIAHVKARHYARMQKASQLPDLLAGIAGMAAAVAAGEPGILVATQAANVAMKLHFSREYETEADELGTIFMTRAGYPPAAITRFFERILAEQRATPDHIPPYLFTHPNVEDRISAVRAQAEKLHPPTAEAASPGDDAALREAQTRLAQLIDARRASLPGPPPPDPALIDPMLAEAERLAAAGEPDAALLQLARAEASQPDDPRVPFRVGELLAEQGRHAEAVDRLPPHGEARPDPRSGLLQARPRLPPDRRATPRGLCLRAGEPAGRARQRAPAPGGLGGGEADLRDRPRVGRWRKAIRSRRTRARFRTRGRASRPARLASAGGRGSAPASSPTARRSACAGWRPTAAWCRTRRPKRPRRPYVGSVLEFGAAGANPPGTWTVEAQHRRRRDRQPALRGASAALSRRAQRAEGAAKARPAPALSPRRRTPARSHSRPRAISAQAPFGASWR